MSGNRFSGLINAARQQEEDLDVQTSEHLEAKNENAPPLKAVESTQPKRKTKKQVKATTPKKPTKTSKHSDVQESKHSDIPTSDPLEALIAERVEKKPNSGKLAKSADPNYVRTTLYLPKDLHRKLKIKSWEADQEMSEIVEELVSDWLLKEQ